MTADEQLKKWVEGTSIHRELEDGDGGECCPDFSCCRPSLKWPREKREKFAELSAKGDDSEMGMLMESLGAMLAAEGKGSTTLYNFCQLWNPNMANDIERND